jgi:hypothetical protein
MLRVAENMIGKSGKCPGCGNQIVLRRPVAKPQTQKVLNSQPPHTEEISKDRERFTAALSIAPDKFHIVEPYMMHYESAVAIAVQRQFPFSLFADIVLLTSHRLMVFRRFFTRVIMSDLNYVDFGNITVHQGFFTATLYVSTTRGAMVTVKGLIIDQALAMYRACQDIETKARIARRQFQLEENRSRTNQIQINNMTGYPEPSNRNVIDSRAITSRDISNVGDEQRDPFRLGE